MWDMEFDSLGNFRYEDSPLISQPPDTQPQPPKNTVFEQLPERSKQFVRLLRQKQTIAVQPFKNEDDLECLIKALEFVRNNEH